MKVLALNWRDLHHPEAGGAEVHLHEILKHLVGWGHQATEIASAFPGCRPEEEIDGVKILRAGHWYDANFTLPRFARRYLRTNPCDIILEDINKLPFFMPRYTDIPVVGVIPHLFGTAVFQEANWLIGSYVVLMEKFIPRVFRKNHFMVISPSTRDDLIARGIGAEKIKVVLCGLDHERYRHLARERFDRPTIVHLGRLRKYKSVEIAMRAMTFIIRSLPPARLVIIGDGPYRETLEKIAASLNLGDAIEFLGYLGAEELVEFLNRSHLLINPSPKEGWGLTVVEANACGLPVVASDRPGLKDSVRDGKTGFLVPYGDAVAFGEKALMLLADGDLWRRMSSGALERVKELTWQRCARETEEFLLHILDSRGRGE
ncbi:MAG: glycosyltransferase family 4 protein [Candidatus Krumholzibacteriota bacterium]|nr:glycosyltransferase family 4 protein [Candidatus Krumholzibacteriota bacterium]